MLTTISISEYAARLASKEPAPGGGSAAALSGVLGASLMEMVINLSQGCSEYAAYETVFAEKQAELVRLRLDLQLLVDRDATAFAAVMKAHSLPQTTKAKKAARQTAIQEAVGQAAEVPLLTARSCLEVMEIGRALLDKINPHTASDLVVGALAGYTGVKGALINTAINLPLLSDQDQASAYRGQFHLIRTAAEDLLEYIENQVYAEATFAVMKD